MPAPSMIDIAKKVNKDYGTSKKQAFGSADAAAPSADDNKDSAIAKALIGLAPIALGAAFGGEAGGAIGAQAGQKGLTMMAEQEQAERENAIAKAASEAAAKEKEFDRQIKMRELAIKENEAANKGSGKELTAQQTERLADHSSSLRQITDLRNAIKNNSQNMGPVAGRLKAMNPYDQDVKGLQGLTDMAAQMIGKSMEGGKLTDQDIIRYKYMLPQVTDSPEVALAKLDNVERMVQQRQQADLGTFGQAGYATQRIQTQGGGLTVPKILQVPEAQAGSDDPVVMEYAKLHGVSPAVASKALARQGYKHGQ